MKPKIKIKKNNMADECDDTSIYAIMNSMVVNTSATVIINGIVEVSQNDRKATLVGFVHILSTLNID